MKVVAMAPAGRPEILRLEVHPPPTAGSDELLVNVLAAGLNRGGLLQRAGHYPPPPGVDASVPGLVYAGEVQACGARALV